MSFKKSVWIFWFVFPVGAGSSRRRLGNLRRALSLVSRRDILKKKKTISVRSRLFGAGSIKWDAARWIWDSPPSSPSSTRPSDPTSSELEGREPCLKQEVLGFCCAASFSRRLFEHAVRDHQTSCGELTRLTELRNAMNTFNPLLDNPRLRPSFYLKITIVYIKHQVVDKEQRLGDHDGGTPLTG